MAAMCDTVGLYRNLVRQIDELVAQDGCFETKQSITSKKVLKIWCNARFILKIVLKVGKTCRIRLLIGLELKSWILI